MAITQRLKSLGRVSTLSCRVLIHGILKYTMDKQCPDPSDGLSHSVFQNATVTQLDRVLGYELRSREFEFLRSHHNMGPQLSWQSSGLLIHWSGVQISLVLPYNTETWQSPVYCNSLENCRMLKCPVSSNLTVSTNGACRQAVKTSDCDSDMRGFKSHQAPHGCIAQGQCNSFIRNRLVVQIYLHPPLQLHSSVGQSTVLIRRGSCVRITVKLPSCVATNLRECTLA